MNNDLVIREATEKDLAAIGPLWRAFMDFHKDRDPFFARSEDGHVGFLEYLRENIASNNALVLVADAAGEIIAYTLATICMSPPVFADRRYGLLNDMAVAEPYRRRGIGEQMVATALEWFKEKDVHRLEVRVAISNEVSTAFWKKMGFETYLETAAKNI